MPSRAPVVLIVDAHEDSLAMYAFGLLAMGFHPVAAQKAEDAFVRACAVHPSVVVIDVTRPGGSGLDLTRRLRRDSRTRNAAIIVLARHADVAEVQHQAFEAGCDRLVVKPCMPDALALAIHDVLVNRADHSRADVQ